MDVKEFTAWQFKAYRALTSDSRLNRSDLSVAQAILEHINCTSETAEPSVARIAAIANVKERTAFKSLKHLQDLDWILKGSTARSKTGAKRPQLSGNNVYAFNDNLIEEMLEERHVRTRKSREVSLQSKAIWQQKRVEFVKKNMNNCAVKRAV